MTARLLAALTAAALAFAQRPAVESAWDLVAQGRRPEAVKLLHEIIQSRPADADARLLLGSLLTEQGDGPEAIAQLNEAVRLRPRSAEAQNALGEALHTFGRPADAAAAFERAVTLDPRLAQAQVNLGMALAETNRPDEAAPHLDRAIAQLGRTPDAALPHYLRAKVYAAHGEASRAAAELEQAVALRPDFPEAWSDLGEARRMLLDRPAALAAFRRAVEVNPQDAVAQYRLGAELLRAGRAEEAIAHLEKSLAVNSANQSALYSLQAALRRAGHPERAEAAKDRLGHLLEEQDQARRRAVTAVELNNAGAILEKDGHIREALEKYRAALALNPDHIGIHLNLAVALLKLGEWREGMAELREALHRDPGNPAIRSAIDDALTQAPQNVH